jgi:ABC transporter, ATP-binding protein
MAFHAQCFGQSARQARASVDAVAAMLNCGYLMDWNVGRLSGGQKKVVEVGLALVGHPSVVLLDEPTLGLNPATRLSLWQTV